MRVGAVRKKGTVGELSVEKKAGLETDCSAAIRQGKKGLGRTCAYLAKLDV